MPHEVYRVKNPESMKNYSLRSKTSDIDLYKDLYKSKSLILERREYNYFSNYHEIRQVVFLPVSSHFSTRGKCSYGNRRLPITLLCS